MITRIGFCSVTLLLLLLSFYDTADAKPPPPFFKGMKSFTILKEN